MSAITRPHFKGLELMTKQQKVLMYQFGKICYQVLSVP